VHECPAIGDGRRAPPPIVAAEAKQNPSTFGHEGVDVAEQRLIHVELLKLHLALDEEGVGQDTGSAAQHVELRALDIQLDHVRTDVVAAAGRVECRQRQRQGAIDPDALAVGELVEHGSIGLEQTAQSRRRGEAQRGLRAVLGAECIGEIRHPIAAGVQSRALIGVGLEAVGANRHHRALPSGVQPPARAHVDQGQCHEASSACGLRRTPTSACPDQERPRACSRSDLRLEDMSTTDG
jgi:hypothetical protein